MKREVHSSANWGRWWIVLFITPELQRSCLILLSDIQLWKQQTARGKAAHASTDTPEFTPQTASRSVQPFLHASRQTVAALHNGPPISPQNYHFPSAFPPVRPTCFLGLTRVHNPNVISIGSAVFGRPFVNGSHYAIGPLSCPVLSVSL